jgi:inorganic pyrophosphatase
MFLLSDEDFALMSGRNHYNRVSAGTDIPRVVNAIVEIPKGRRSKFEVDKDTGLMKLDRYLFSSSHYPGDYGFIPQTLAEDGDALDILVMVNEPTFSGCLIEARVVGLFRMIDRGKHDYKVLGVPNDDPLFDEIKDVDDVPRHFLREVEHFFATYKQLEGVHVEGRGWDNAAAATEEVRSSVRRFREAHPELADAPPG